MHSCQWLSNLPAQPSLQNLRFQISLFHPEQKVGNKKGHKLWAKIVDQIFWLKKGTLNLPHYNGQCDHLRFHPHDGRRWVCTWRWNWSMRRRHLVVHSSRTLCALLVHTFGAHSWCTGRCAVHTWCSGWWLGLSNTWHLVGGQTACKYICRLTHHCHQYQYHQHSIACNQSPYIAFWFMPVVGR